MDTLNFGIDYYKVLQEDDYIMLLEADIVNTAPNYNTAPFTEEAIINAIPSLANKPLIAVESYDHKPTDHAKSDYDREKIKVVGIFPESNNAKIVEKNGYKMLRANIAVWKYYNEGLVDFIRKNALESKNVKLSMEIAIKDSYKDENNLTHITSFSFIGICLLGNDVTPAILNSGITVSKFSVDNDIANNINKRLTTYSIPDKVKENTKQALGMKQKNPQLVNIAKEITNSDVLTYSRIEFINNKINSLRKEENLIFYGGNESKEWCESILNIQNYSKKGDKKMEEEKMSTPATSEEVENKEEVQKESATPTEEVQEESCDNKQEESVAECSEEPQEEKEDKKEVAEESCNEDKKDFSIELQLATEKLVKLTADYETLQQNYSVAMEKLAVFEAKEEEARKAEIKDKAESKLSEFSKYVDKDEKASLMEVLESDGFDMFSTKLNSLVLPKVMAEVSATTKKTVNTSTQEYSYVPNLTNVENETKPRTSRDILREMAKN